MDAALFEGREGGKGWYFVDRSLAMQPPGDGGWGRWTSSGFSPATYI
jgi:hypothetical protein